MYITCELDDEKHVLLYFVGSSRVWIDEKEFESYSFQRAIQYLKQHVEGVPLDSFTYTFGSMEATPKQGLTILLR